MDQQQIAALYPLALDVRALFHQMRAAIGTIHADAGISAGMRAVLENVIVDGPQTVPRMARARPVTRQHIQSLVNDLMAEGLVEYRANPAHKRSQLVCPTEAGKAAFDALTAHEIAVFAQIDVGLSPEEIDEARRVLDRLLTTFRRMDWEKLASRGGRAKPR